MVSQADENVEPDETMPDGEWLPVQQQAFDKHRTQQLAARAELGRRIMGLRLNKRWSQSELARAAGLNKNLINTTERGKSQPRLDNLQAIASALGVKVGDLTGIYEEDAVKAQAHPTVSGVEIPGHPELMWLTINRPVRLGTAAKIYAILDEDDAHKIVRAAQRG